VVVLEKDGKIIWSDRGKNEERCRVKEERNIIRTIKKEGRLTGLVTSRV
jgi:hypothetical protein